MTKTSPAVSPRVSRVSQSMTRTSPTLTPRASRASLLTAETAPPPASRNSRTSRSIAEMGHTCLTPSPSVTNWVSLSNMKKMEHFCRRISVKWRRKRQPLGDVIQPSTKLTKNLNDHIDEKLKVGPNLCAIMLGIPLLLPCAYSNGHSQLQSQWRSFVIRTMAETIHTFLKPLNLYR